VRNISSIYIVDVAGIYTATAPLRRLCDDRALLLRWLPRGAETLELAFWRTEVFLGPPPSDPDDR